MQFVFPHIQRPFYLARRVESSPGKWKQAQHLYMKCKCPLSSQSMGRSLQVIPIFITGIPHAHSSLHNCLHFFYYVIYTGRTQLPTCKHQLCIFSYSNCMLKTRPGFSITLGFLWSIHQNCKPGLECHHSKILPCITSQQLPKAIWVHQRPHLEHVKMLTSV